ncbi:MAG: Fic family protein [Dehalococcoidia bacterium]
MARFEHLRSTPWKPTFDWVTSTLAAARRINVWHEDYPRRVKVTHSVISTFRARKLTGPDGVAAGVPVPNAVLLKLHRDIFRDQPIRGKWRSVSVIVGQHLPPGPAQVPGLMEELQKGYLVRTVEDLIAWYTDFQTIHPFQDGNGRVGGVIVATYSHMLHPDRGWLAPNQ